MSSGSVGEKRRVENGDRPGKDQIEKQKGQISHSRNSHLWVIQDKYRHSGTTTVHDLLTPTTRFTVVLGLPGPAPSFPSTRFDWTLHRISYGPYNRPLPSLRTVQVRGNPLSLPAPEPFYDSWTSCPRTPTSGSLSPSTREPSLASTF